MNQFEQPNSNVLNMLCFYKAYLFRRVKIIRKGFSLIELMVVITVIGILAAIAIPTYNQYIIKSRIVPSADALMRIANKMIEYWNIRGAFPDAQQLGLSTGNQYFVDTNIAQDIMPYFSTATGFFQIRDRNIQGCLGRIGKTAVYLAPDELGFDSSYNYGSAANGNGVLLEIYLAHYNGVVYKIPQIHICTEAGVCQPFGSSIYLSSPWYSSGDWYNDPAPSTDLYNIYANAECGE